MSLTVLLTAYRPASRLAFIGRHPAPWSSQLDGPLQAVQLQAVHGDTGWSVSQALVPGGSQGRGVGRGAGREPRSRQTATVVTLP